MSTHRNDFLVSSHQAKLHREAAEARLARDAREHKQAATEADSQGFLARLTLALRRRPDVHVPRVTPTSVSPTVRS